MLSLKWISLARERGPVGENRGLGVHFYASPIWLVLWADSITSFAGSLASFSSRYWPSFPLSEICARTPADPTRPAPTILSEKRWSFRV